VNTFDDLNQKHCPLQYTIQAIAMANQEDATPPQTPHEDGSDSEEQQGVGKDDLPLHA
jgi:hypothetical protein